MEDYKKQIKKEKIKQFIFLILIIIEIPITFLLMFAAHYSIFIAPNLVY